MTNSINKRPATPSPTQVSTNLNEKAAKRNKKDSETNNSVRKKSKWWRSEEIISLLNAVEEVKPCGKNQWDIVSGLHYDSTKNVRDGDSCKLKFDRLWQTKKPTGTAEIPVHIARALDIKELISREECIGNAGLNDVVDEDDIEVLANGGSPSNVISSTHLFDKIENSPRPSTRKKVSNIAEAISSLGSDMKDASKMMVSVVGGISNNQNDSIESFNNRVTIVNDNYVSLHNKVTIVEIKLEKIDSGMKTILDFIKNK